MLLSRLGVELLAVSSKRNVELDEIFGAQLHAWPDLHIARGDHVALAIGPFSAGHREVLPHCNNTIQHVAVEQPVEVVGVVLERNDP